MGAVCIASHYLSGGVGESNGGALTISKVAEDASIWAYLFYRHAQGVVANRTRAVQPAAQLQLAEPTNVTPTGGLGNCNVCSRPVTVFTTNTR